MGASGMTSNRTTLYPSRAGRGFTIIELLVALTVGLILLLALSQIYVANSMNRTEIDRSSRMIENGTFAIDRMADDLRKAGYFSDLDMSLTGLTTPAALPDICATTLSAIGQPSVAQTTSPLTLPVQGYDAPSAAATAVLPASCAAFITDMKKGSDVIAVRRADTCVAGPTAAAGCDAVVAGRPYLQASQCSPIPPAAATELATGNSWDEYKLDKTTANLTMHKIDCNVAPPGTTAAYHRFMVNIYYVANNDTGTDGIPTLKLAQLDGAGGGLTFTVTPLAEGIENMQIEYGLDTNVAGVCNAGLTGDGTPDVYTADPGVYTVPCAPAATVPQKWATVTSVKIHLLARNTEKTAPGEKYVNSKTFNLGTNADGTANTVGPFNDAFRRHVYATFVRLYNPSGRR
jgi:type IV pilus assembly protein PilW